HAAHREERGRELRRRGAQCAEPAIVVRKWSREDRGAIRACAAFCTAQTCSLSPGNRHALPVPRRCQPQGAGRCRATDNSRSAMDGARLSRDGPIMTAFAKALMAVSCGLFAGLVYEMAAPLPQIAVPRVGVPGLGESGDVVSSFTPRPAANYAVV